MVLNEHYSKRPNMSLCGTPVRTEAYGGQVISGISALVHLTGCPVGTQNYPALVCSTFVVEHIIGIELLRS